MRDLDIDMFYDKEKKEYYCIRCQFTGTEEDVLKFNEMVRVRYKFMYDRFTNFGFDMTEELEKAEKELAEVRAAN